MLYSLGDLIAKPLSQTGVIRMVLRFEPLSSEASTLR